MRCGASLASLLAIVLWLPVAAGAGDFVDHHPKVADAVELLDLWIEEQLAYHQIPGLAIGVIYDQELIWAKGYGHRDVDAKIPVTPATRFRIGSVTKVFTATAILQLRDAGKLRLDDPINRHLPELTIENPFPEAPPITIWNLLTHTGGLPREAAWPYWTDHEFPTVDELVRSTATQTLIHSPGTRYKYSNLGTSLLGAIIERLSGQSYRDYVTENIFDPLTMTDSAVDPEVGQTDLLATAYMRRQPDGSRGIMDYYEVRGMAAMGSIVSTVEDLAKFAALNIRQGDSMTDGPVLSTATMREMHRPHWVYSSWEGAMGLGFRVAPRDGVNTVSHGGWIGDHRAHLLMVPEKNLAVVAMTNAGDASPYTFSYEALDLLSAAIGADPQPTEEPRIDPSWERYLGLYSDPWGWETRVLVLDRQLALYSSSYPPADGAREGITRLKHVEGTTFQIDEGEYLAFELNEAGEVVRIKDRSNYLFPANEHGGQAPSLHPEEGVSVPEDR
jgi:CubicO group peptidase (beta-lactamase class C family)